MIPDFMPHAFCLSGNLWTLWISVMANLIIALAYYGIAIGIYNLLRKKVIGSIVSPTIWYGFAAFIGLCGTTHVMDIVVIWTPVYNLQNFVSTLTAAISAITALVFIPEAIKLVKRHFGRGEEIFERHRNVERSGTEKSEHLAEMEKILKERGLVK